MSAVKEVKLAGFKDLQTTAEMIGRSAQYLSRIFKSNREQFDIILLGCIEKNREAASSNMSRADYSKKRDELLKLIGEVEVASSNLSATEAKIKAQ